MVDNDSMDLGNFFIMLDLNGILPLMYLFLFPYTYIKLSFTNIFCLMEFAENKKLERASCHFYSYFGTNYFDVFFNILFVCIIPTIITIFCSTWKTTKIKWSRHRSFLYGCDRSPEIYVLESETEIPNLKTT